ncbi:hypothetical protein CAPTEDRAFT_206055 [Capitella teleta]|uniref:Uncharacterized protein n=1 Tax=Capitella teleta TaxID=283909 RepID=R7UY36_CAPTE|nr:hypothetical protein CAPTEDRAFT_206055 [Capitella teleta]|eukprot:ELU08867.1 hypothetical protein CAPTEDRAFT_206055 [Capitella teleta]
MANDSHVAALSAVVTDLAKAQKETSSQIAALASIGTKTPQFQKQDVPNVWVTDRINLQDLYPIKKEQFSDAYIEASQETDETMYVIEDNLLFTMVEPGRNAGRYRRLLLPQQYRKQVIDRCHAEVGHAAFFKTLARVQKHHRTFDPAYTWTSPPQVHEIFIPKERTSKTKDMMVNDFHMEIEVERRNFYSIMT